MSINYRLLLSASIVAIVCICATPAQTSSIRNTIQGPHSVDTLLTGVWTGVLNPSARSDVRRVIIRLTKTLSGTCDALVDMPSQRFINLQPTMVICTNNQLVVALSDEVVFKGTINTTSTTIVGIWTEGTNNLPLSLTRIQRIPPPAVQPLRGVAVAVEATNGADGVLLAGELLVPNTNGRWPLVILINDDAPRDRNATQFGQRPFYNLADEFSALGWATLRMDDRGTGSSTGNKIDASVQQLATDVNAAIASVSLHPNIDTSRIVLVGMGTGGIVAAAAAAMHPQLSGVALLATPCMDGLGLLKAQIELAETGYNTPADVTERYKQTVAQWMRVLRSGLDKPMMVAAILEAADALLVLDERSWSLPTMEPFLLESREDYVLENVIPWLQVFDRISPGPHLRALHVPVLALFAVEDSHVPARPNIDGLRQWLNDGTQAHIEVLPGLNHRFQQCILCTPEEMRYLPEAIDRTIVRRICTWAERIAEVVPGTQKR